MSRWPIPFATLLVSCSTVVGNPKKPTTTPTPAPAPAPSVVDDADAQKQVVTQDLTTVVAAISDGATAGDTINGFGLTESPDLSLLAKFSEARSCSVAPIAAAVSLASANGAASWQLGADTSTATVTRTYTGQTGNKTYQTNSDGTPSADAEVWYPGPYFGLANIATTASSNAGALPTTGSTPPGIPAPSPGAPAGSSGQLGSVGWRSTDGSWTGAPVWEVGIGYVGDGPLPVQQTEGMVMYYTANLPAVTAAATPPTAGGAYAPTAMVTAKGKASPYSVLGQFGDGALPSFTATGSGFIGGKDKPLQQAGQITAPALPAVMYNPPGSITCTAGQTDVAPGWRFSQNVAGLTRLATTKTSYSLAYRSGSAENTAAGSTTTTWQDPATTPPVQPATGAAAPYYDQNAGLFTVNRSLALGSADRMNTYTSQLIEASGKKRAVSTSKGYTSVPFSDTLTRDLNNKFTWVTRTIGHGTLVSTHSLGDAEPIAKISTSFSDVVFRNNGDQAASCVPKSGTVTATIEPIDQTKQTTTITLKFGTTAAVSTPSGVTATVSCSGGAPGATNCQAAAETDDPDFKPSGCNF